MAKQVTAAELRLLDPKRFNREYYDWREYALSYDWWETVEDEFRLECKSLGIRVDGIQFSMSYSQSDNAVFMGRIDVADAMKNMKLNEKYLALYLAVRDDGSYAMAIASHRGNIQTSMDCYPNQTAPSGVFSDLAQEDWEDLIDNQMVESDLEEEIQKYATTLCHKLYHKLRDEYEHRTSEDSFIESCECNEVTFTLETEDEIYP